MSQAQSISLSHFTKSVQAAVKAAQEKHPKFHMEAPQGITFSYLIRGIPSPRLFSRTSPSETQEFANTVAAEVGRQAGIAELKSGTQGAVYSVGRHVILGIPPVEQFLMKENKEASHAKALSQCSTRHGQLPCPGGGSAK